MSYDVRAFNTADVNNMAFATSDSYDPVESNNQSRDALLFVGESDAEVFVNKICDTEPLAWDAQTVLCTVIVHNLAGGVARNVTLRDTLVPINQQGDIDLSLEILEPLPTGCSVATHGEPFVVWCNLGSAQVRCGGSVTGFEPRTGGLIRPRAFRWSMRRRPRSSGSYPLKSSPRIALTLVR